jgi:Protein of unknown function (DUF5132)
MRIQPMSFLLGLGVATVLPLISRVVRPLAVEAAAAGMGLFEEARRLLAEQMETLEDVAAEARARREQLVHDQLNGNGNGNGVSALDGAGEAPRRRRRKAPAAGDTA